MSGRDGFCDGPGRTARIWLSSFSVLHCALYTCLLWGFSPSPHICTFPPFHQERSYKVLHDLNTVKLKGIPSCQFVPSVSMRSAVGHCVGRRHPPPSLLHVPSSSTMYQRDPGPQTQAFSFCHPHSSLRWSRLKQMNFISS